MFNNKSVTSVFHARDIVMVTDNTTVPFTPTDLAINFQPAHNDRLE